jgi:hypothetical protein
VIGVLCGFAAATVLNAADDMVWRSRRDARAARPAPEAVMIGGRTAAYPDPMAELGV